LLRENERRSASNTGTGARDHNRFMLEKHGPPSICNVENLNFLVHAQAFLTALATDTAAAPAARGNERAETATVHIHRPGPEPARHLDRFAGVLAKHITRQ